ncbi:MAG TPA: enoyl-CoA hydratase-related protein [Syntrophobacteria bacterium]|nr:enoyl-CoA hydratase-related protein [Syntrophobacteria bacterium]
MTYENILFSVAGGIARLTFNRPKVLNALNLKTVQEVADAVRTVEADEAIRVLILTGAGDKAFVAGADISELQKLTPIGAAQFGAEGQNVLFAIENLPIPTIACVNGFALGGGCEIAMTCDFIYASDKARFGQPEINLGLIPGFGGTQRLLRLVGRARAKEICLTGAMISAKEAMEMGLVNKVFPPESLMEETMKVATLMASKGKVALKSIKQVINRGMDTDLRTGCALEIEAFALTFASPDAKEGTTAFLEKRAATFAGSRKQ